MKLILSLLLGLLVVSSGLTQDYKSWSIEANLASLIDRTGVFNDVNYSSQLHYLSGVKVLYNKSSITSYFVSFESANTNVTIPGGFVNENVDSRGIEIRAGMKWWPTTHEKFNLLLGAEVFTEFSKVNGQYMQDAGPPYGTLIRHRRNYFGIAPSLTLDYKLKEKIHLFLESRYRMGSVSLKEKSGESPQLMLDVVSNATYWKNEFEFLSSFGLRFDI